MTAEAFREITRRINGGFNGLADRQQYYEKAKAILGVVAPAADGRVSFDLDEEDAGEPIFERGLEGSRTERVASPRRRKTARKTAGRKGTAKKAGSKKTAAKKTTRKKTAAKKRGVKPAAKKQGAKKAVRKGAAPKKR